VTSRPTKVVVHWAGQKWMNDEHRQLIGNLDAAAIRVDRHIKRIIGGSGGAAGTRSGATARERGRSAPWTPPFRQTGHLLRSIGWERNGWLRRRVGSGIGGKSGVGYAMWLEFGTRRMFPRPFLRRGLYESAGAVARCIRARKPHHSIFPWRRT